MGLISLRGQIFATGESGTSKFLWLPLEMAVQLYFNSGILWCCQCVCAVHTSKPATVQRQSGGNGLQRPHELYYKLLAQACPRMPQAYCLVAVGACLR